MIGRWFWWTVAAALCHVDRLPLALAAFAIGVAGAACAIVYW